jgi:hypothetical protein
VESTDSGSYPVSCFVTSGVKSSDCAIIELIMFTILKPVSLRGAYFDPVKSCSIEILVLIAFR